MADIVYNLNDLDELTACSLTGSACYLSMIRLIVFTSHQKNMLYVVETMRRDWTCSSYEDRVILREKCLFAFRLAKSFIIMVIATLTIFACIPILEVRNKKNHSFNISIICDMYRLSQDTKIVSKKIKSLLLNSKVIFRKTNS